MVQSPPEVRALAHLLGRYREANSTRGGFELAITAVPFLVIWALMWAALDHGYWIACWGRCPLRACSSVSS